LTIISLNKALAGTDAASAGPETHALMTRWGSRHAVRTALGAAAIAAFLSSLV
jgi:hypothetical protein